MQAYFFVFATAALCTGVAYGQQLLPRTFPIQHAEPGQQVEQLATTVRSIGNVRSVNVREPERTLSIEGTSEQVALVEWLLRELDLPPSPGRPMAEYRMGSNDVVRIFWLAYRTDVLSLQEIATTVRAVGDVQRLFTNTAHEALVIRGSAGQASFAEWLVRELDRAPAGHREGSAEYRFGADDLVRTFYLKHRSSPRQLQFMATTMRSIGLIRRLFIKNAQSAVVARGTAAQIALAEWLVGQLDTAQAAAVAGFKVPGDGDEYVRVLDLGKSRTPAEINALLSSVRSTAGIQMLMGTAEPPTLVARGTAEQMTAVERLVNPAR